MHIIRMRDGVVRYERDKELEKGGRHDKSMGDAGPHSVAGRRGLVATAKGVATLQVRREPSDNISITDFVTFCGYEGSMVQSVIAL